MKRIISMTILMLLLGLISVNICACRKAPSTGDSGSALVTDGGQDATSTQEASNVNPDASATRQEVQTPNRATVIVQVHNASTNKNAFHVSLEGLAGSAAPRILPGGGVNLQKDISAVDGKFPVSITISRNGNSLAVLSQNISNSSASVIIFETRPGEFNAQWI